MRSAVSTANTCYFAAPFPAAARAFWNLRALDDESVAGSSPGAAGAGHGPPRRGHGRPRGPRGRPWSAEATLATDAGHERPARLGTVPAWCTGTPAPRFRLEGILTG